MTDNRITYSFPKERIKVLLLENIHRNTPGILAKVNALLAENNANLEGQYLGTKDEVGYVITDVNASYKKAVVAELRKLPETIRMRVLY